MSETIHFGHIIKRILKEKRIGVGEFAKMMNGDRCNMYKILERPHLDSDFLLRASKVLNHDLFREGSIWYQHTKHNNYFNVVDLATFSGKYDNKNILK